MSAAKILSPLSLKWIQQATMARRFAGVSSAQPNPL